MKSTTKVYPRVPARQGKAPKYGSDEYPKVTPEELAIVREVFWDIFMVKHEGDCFNELAKALGCDRNRAKQVYYWSLFQKGFMQNQQAVERKIRAKLAVRILKYTEFLENPETVYQILCRAEDEVAEDEENRNRARRSQS